MPANHIIKASSELQQGEFPPHILHGDGLMKLNLSSFTTMFYHGWVNVDIEDLAGFAQANGYRFMRHDLRINLPNDTGSVDAIFAHHAVEHLNYKDGLNLLKECRRVLKPSTGVMRLVVPNAQFLCDNYISKGVYSLGDFDEMNGGCANASTPMKKLHALMCDGHAALYDEETLCAMLKEAGFHAHPTSFRHTQVSSITQILRETTEMDYAGTSLFVDAVPAVG